MLQVLNLAQADLALIPLHHHVPPWLASSTVSGVHRADNLLDSCHVKID